MSPAKSPADATTIQPPAAIEMCAAKAAGTCTRQECNKASRIRGGGAAKDCFLAAIECFLCFEFCKVCCECCGDILCCPCELCCG